MTGPDQRALSRDIGGKGAIKFAVVTCLIAMGVAMYSPSFKANPVLAGPVNEIRQELPKTFEKIRDAMGG